MSSISSIGLSFQASAVGSSRGSNPARRLEQDLSKYLSAKGVSSDDQSTIQDEIKQAIASSTSDGSRPTPSTVQSAVKSVLDKHGLQGDDFVSKIPSLQARSNAGGFAQGAAGRPSGPPPGGHAGRPPGPRPVDQDGDSDDSSVSTTNSSSNTSNESFIQKLLTLLAEVTSGSDSQSASKASATYSNIANTKNLQAQLQAPTSLDYLA